MDAVDAALIHMDGERPQLLHAINFPYPQQIRNSILPLLHEPEQIPFGQIVHMELQFADLFSEAVTELLKGASIGREQITAIGCHGQTLCHRPENDPPYTIQLGDNGRLSALTGMTVIGDFRSADVADGGQGAPLASLLHQALFSSPHHRHGIVNIGGIANLTVLPATSASDNSLAIQGFDTGPGNGLMDQWYQQHQNGAYDENGSWAAGGQIIPDLLRRWLETEEYFRLPAPKSTGREVFNLNWLKAHSPDLSQWDSRDVQATLLALSAQTIADACHQQMCEKVFICGGGAHNQALMTKLQDLLPQCSVSSTDTIGLAPDWVEAVLFAWLAWRYEQNIASALPSITGSQHARVIGARWRAPIFT